MSDFYAHSRLNPDGSLLFEPLEEHLKLVSQKAAEFGAIFEAEDWCEVLGFWHDLGKYSKEFQNYLRSVSNADPHVAERMNKVDHSTAGAQHAVIDKRTDSVGKAIAWCIAGHHTGLGNYSTSEQITCLVKRLEKQNIPTWFSAPQTICSIEKPKKYPPKVQHSLDRKDESGTSDAKVRGRFAWAFFVRMLYSCLVDADFLATEVFMNEASSKERNTQKPSLHELLRYLVNHQEELGKRSVSEGKRSDVVFSIRQKVVESCVKAASLPPGFFTLTVPTGGGKTLASLRFALEHAINHQAHAFRHIIVGIPFTSIIEQTAGVYRRVFEALGDEVVLEHHSNTGVERETTFSRLSSQNYDAPIIVTTNVQILESLFTNKPGKARKIHRFAKSIIILDEAQAMPVELLTPTLFALQELVDTYGCTVILSTATPPALGFQKEFPIGLKQVREIVPLGLNLGNQMKRTFLTDLGRLDIEELVRLMGKNDQFLCIHNTRKDTKDTYDALRTKSDGEGLFHLSTFMCPAHRRDCLDRVRERLASGKECKVISTQLIEAGVDVDFPVVYRAIAGVDSITQAAGRCNREGRISLGEVLLFRLPHDPPMGMLRKAAGTTQSLLGKFPGDQLLSEQAIHEYFRMLYWKEKQHWDSKEILPMHLKIGQVNFESIANAYRLIEDDTLSVIVPYSRRGRSIIGKLLSCDIKQQPLTLEEHRETQQFSVSLFKDVVRQNLGGDFKEVCDGQFIVTTNDSLYTEETGIDLSKFGWIDPGRLVV